MSAALPADLRKLWEFMRSMAGEDAYERYLERHARTHPEVPPLSQAQFFADEQRRKWSGVNRCC